MMISIFLLALCITSIVSGHEDLPEELPKEVYCAGCTATIKIMGRWLVDESLGSIENRVEKAITNACEKKNFENIDMSPKYLSLACKHLVENHRGELKENLLSHYSKKHRKHGQTYLDIAHKVCNEGTYVCTGGEKLDSENGLGEGSKVYIDDDGEYKVEFGENVKVMRPVSEDHITVSRDEL